MASRPASFSQLWQMPLLLCSFGLFGYATYLLWDPKTGPTPDQRLDAGRQLMNAERPEATVELLNGVLKLDKLTPAQKSRTHLMLAEAVEMYQDQKKVQVPALQQRIIEQTRLALAQEQPIDGRAYRRVARAFEMLGQTNEALDNYKLAAARDPERELRLNKKIIELKLAVADSSVDDDLKDYLKTEKLTDAERCWRSASVRRCWPIRRNSSKPVFC
ncbi:MAG: hypothetical protein QM754_19755 [Tepidisphaeraceae bacterium]